MTNKPKTAAAKSPAAPGTAEAKDSSGRATRETIESIAVAVILAFLFRAFVAEAFVIPTGSMAPTLQGRHMDVVCEKCGCPYRTGASVENDGDGEVTGTTCPICRYTMALRKGTDPNQRSFNGDRILVSKFAYEIGDPERWDVIVFKYPGNAKQNYIKRLVGLPNETIRIRHGDVHVLPASRVVNGEDSDFHIARKPPFKLHAMLQLVDDTRYRAQELKDIGWPERWQDWGQPQEPAWRAVPDGGGFVTTGQSPGEAWLRYRHVVPWDEDWEAIEDGRLPQRMSDGVLFGQLVTDEYAYNHGVEHSNRYADADRARLKAAGVHWVGDLAVECRDLEVRGERGKVLFDLVEGGVHFTCRIDVATGQAVLSINGGQAKFVDDDGQAVPGRPQATTKLSGAGTYDVRFANCDDQLVLWVNGSVVEFDRPTTFDPGPKVSPKWSVDDAGDLEPAGLGAEGVALSIGSLRVLRDVYYVATTSETQGDDDYEDFFPPRDRERTIRSVMADPTTWDSTPLFDSRRTDVQFTMADGQFFPMGDNSPQSRDARLWSHFDRFENRLDPPPFVERRLLTGKALLIYWPHSWRRPIPFWPNFRRMGLIR